MKITIEELEKIRNYVNAEIEHNYNDVLTERDKNTCRLGAEIVITYLLNN